jgi:hypothetical protein
LFRADLLIKFNDKNYPLNATLRSRKGKNEINFT